MEAVGESRDGPSGALPMIAARPLERYQVSKMREELLAGDASPVIGRLVIGLPTRVVANRIGRCVDMILNIRMRCACGVMVERTSGARSNSVR